MATKAKIGVLGASGYTGGELVRMLLRHPRGEIVLLTAERSAGKAMREVFPQFSPFTLPTLVAIDGLDWTKAGTRRRVLRAAACDHAEGDQGSAGEVAGDQGGRPVGRFPAGATPRPMPNGTATSIMRRNCRRKRSTASPKSIGATSRQARLVANPGCYTSLRRAAAHPADQGQGDRPRRDRRSTPSPA